VIAALPAATRAAFAALQAASAALQAASDALQATSAALQAAAASRALHTRLCALQCCFWQTLLQ